MKKQLIKKQNFNLDFLTPHFEKFKMGGEMMKECAEANSETGKLLMKFLWARDQAHLFHWQTKLNSHHVNLGTFYEEYLEELDELVESILGKTLEVPTVGEGVIRLKDYSDSNLKEYLMKITKLFTADFNKYFDKNASENVGLYHTVGDIIELVSKLKYLLAQK